MEKVFFERNNKGKPYLPYVARNQSIFNYLPHYHAEVEIILLRQGRTILTVDGSCILLTSRDIFVVSPNKIHSFRSSIKNDLYIMKLYTPNCLLDYNLNLHICVYGKYADTDESPDIKKIPCVTFHGLIPHSDLLLKYRQSGLFIQNSIVESFGLAVIEAIACGCDILTGEKTGATDIIGDLQNEDIIHDYADISEIKRKIEPSDQQHR